MDFSSIVDALVRESARCEWKKGVADEEDVAQNLVAFANDIEQQGGGCVICGVEETTNEHGKAVANPVGLDPVRLKRLQKLIPILCRDRAIPAITPRTEVVDIPGIPDRQLLAFFIDSTPHAVQYKNRKDETHYWIRVRDEKERANGRLPELLRLKGALPHLLEGVEASADIQTLDLPLLRGFIQTLSLPQPEEHYLSPDVRIFPEVPSLMARHKAMDGTSKVAPRKFTLLLFGREPSRFVPGAWIDVTFYPGVSRTDKFAESAQFHGPIPVIIPDLMRRLQPYLGMHIDKGTPLAGGSQNRPLYSRRAVEEAIVNAIAHRDYQSNEPVHIDVFSDRLEISNPGGLVHQLHREAFRQGKAFPEWRNPSLAQYMYSLGLAQRKGQGVPTILEETLKTAQRPVQFELDRHRTSVIIPSYQATPLQQALPPDHTGQGLILISIGGPSIHEQVQASLEFLGLQKATVAIDFAASGYIDSSREWERAASEVREQIQAVIDRAEFKDFHLFYRGPVVLAPLVGALIVPAKRLYLYTYEEGRYNFTFRIDRKFLKA